MVMKLSNLLFLSILVVSVFFTSCGSSKNAQGGGVNPYGEAVAVDICQTMAEESPQTRAFGEAKHFKMSTARNLAAMEARAEFSDRVGSAIKKALGAATLQDAQAFATEDAGTMVYDGLGISVESIESLSKNLISNTMIIKTSSYYNSKNKMYHVFVCVEYADGIDGMKKSIVNSINQQIPDEKKAELEFRIDEFEKGIEEELGKMVGSGN